MDNHYSTASQQALRLIADFYNGCKHGYEGHEGYRKSTDPFKLLACIEALHEEGLLRRDETLFADLGCADGRVNVLMSYFVRQSIGIEIDPDIVAEYAPRRQALGERLSAAQLPQPPDNVCLLAGSSLDAETYAKLRAAAGIGFEDIDLFYTYITLHDVFAEKIAAEAKAGALYLVYGFNKVLPQYAGLNLLQSDVAAQGIVALYRKESS